MKQMLGTKYFDISWKLSKYSSYLWRNIQLFLYIFVTKITLRAKKMINEKMGYVNHQFVPSNFRLIGLLFFKQKSSFFVQSKQVYRWILGLSKSEVCLFSFFTQSVKKHQNEWLLLLEFIFRALLFKININIMLREI